MKADLFKLKEEMKQEIKASRDSFEWENCGIKSTSSIYESKNMAQRFEFAFSSIEEHKKPGKAVADSWILECENAVVRAQGKCLESKGQHLETRLVLAEQYST